MKTVILAAGLMAASPAFAGTCKGVAQIVEGGVQVARCWSHRAEIADMIARACDDDDVCEINGAIRRRHEIDKVWWATGPKGMFLPF